MPRFGAGDPVYILSKYAHCRPHGGPLNMLVVIPQAMRRILGAFSI